MPKNPNHKQQKKPLLISRIGIKLGAVRKSKPKEVLLTYENPVGTGQVETRDAITAFLVLKGPGDGNDAFYSTCSQQ